MKTEAKKALSTSGSPVSFITGSTSLLAASSNMAFWTVDISRRSFHVHSHYTYGRDRKETNGVRIEGDRPMIAVGAKQQMFLKT